MSLTRYAIIGMLIMLALCFLVRFTHWAWPNTVYGYTFLNQFHAASCRHFTPRQMPRATLHGKLSVYLSVNAIQSHPKRSYSVCCSALISLALVSWRVLACSAFSPS
jgi:hypothetical protein